jgi:hypothetical protein
MPLEIDNLRELDPESIATTLTTMAQLMQEAHPDVELTRGVFHDLVLYFNSVLNTAVRENIERVRQSNSLLKITQNPALAESELVDQVLSNFNISRGAGTPATGSVTFVFLLDVVTTISSAHVYSAGDAEFRPAQTFTVFPPGQEAKVQDATSEKVMIPVGDGTYTVSVPFVATTAGIVGNIRRGTKLRANIVPSNVSDIFATGDFTGGRNPRTNEEYLQTLATGLAAKTIGGRKSYEAFIRNQPAFVNVLHCSVLGCGDAEQQRDQHSLFPVSGGGKVDLYLQTTAAAQELDHTLEATYIGVGTGGTIWQVVLDRDVAPGFYDITRIAGPADRTTNGYAVLSDERGVDLSQISYVPDILYTIEGAYTRYQTAVVRFEDSDKLSTNLVPQQSKARYTVTTRGMPLIADIHDTLTSRNNRPRATDLLVKAAVPCFTKVSLEVRTENNETLTAETIAAIQKAVANAVSAIGFSGQLHASVIASAAHKFLTGRQALGQIDMFGRIRRPDGTVHYLRDATTLTIPDDPSRLTTGRTTVFIVSPDDVSVSYTSAGFTG